MTDLSAVQMSLLIRVMTRLGIVWVGLSLGVTALALSVARRQMRLSVVDWEIEIVIEPRVDAKGDGDAPLAGRSETTCIGAG